MSRRRGWSSLSEEGDGEEAISDRRCGASTTVCREKVLWRRSLDYRALPGMNGSVGVACPVPILVLHLPIDGRPTLTQETTPFSIGDGLSALDDLCSFWWRYLRF
ncbi:hypothetical protein YC2023_104763 [Brassica napus]